MGQNSLLPLPFILPFMFFLHATPLWPLPGLAKTNSKSAGTGWSRVNFTKVPTWTSDHLGSHLRGKVERRLLPTFYAPVLKGSWKLTIFCKHPRNLMLLKALGPSAPVKTLQGWLFTSALFHHKKTAAPRGSNIQTCGVPNVFLCFLSSPHQIACHGLLRYQRIALLTGISSPSCPTIVPPTFQVLCGFLIFFRKCWSWSSVEASKFILLKVLFFSILNPPSAACPHRHLCKTSRKAPRTVVLKWPMRW